MTELLMAQIVTGVITVGVGAVLAHLRRRTKNENSKEVLEEVKECLLEGMAESQNRIVRPAKAGGKKLDSATITDAEVMAISFAKKAATGKALDMLESMSSGRTKSMIKQLLR